MNSANRRNESRPAVIKPGKANIRVVFQLAAQILPRNNEPVEAILEECRRIALEWLREKFPDSLPPQAYQGDYFEIGEHGQTITSVPVPEEGVWCVRLEQPDAPFGERPAVPGRFWTTDIALRRHKGAVCFGIRVQCASLEYARHPITLTRPRIVRDIAQRFTLREARDLDGRPWKLESFDDLRDFESFLLDPLRNMPVILLTQPDRNRLHMGVSEFLLEPDWLAQHLQGFAYVATMPRNLGFRWTDLVGKPWSAFLGAVRTYMPGLDYDQDSPISHPLTFAEKILLWRYADDRGEFTGERAFERFLVARIHEHAAAKRVNWLGCVFVPEARPLRAALLRKQTQDDAEWRALYEAEIDALQRQLKEAKDLTLTAEQIADYAERERDYYRDECSRLRIKNEALRSTLLTRTGDTSEEIDTQPSDYADLPEWVAKSFVGQLELHPRAIRALKDAVYQDLPLACRALEILADEYRNMRLGHPGSKEVWETALRESGLEFSGSIAEHRAGEEGDTYFVNYPIHSGRRELLKFHLRRGNSRDASHCLRVYFFWHDETQQVVVGWLPSHLDTRST